MHALKFPLFACAMLVAACSGPSNQVLIPPSSPELRVRSVVSSISIRDISLPRYAAGDDLVMLGEDGILDTLDNTIWADSPERSLTLKLATDLGDITGARVAPEPWPFLGSPAAQITVQASRLLAKPDGLLNFAGQYAIAGVDSGLTDRLGNFDISVPMVGTGPGAQARAQSKAIAELAELIARRLSR